jgi:dTDP-4-amino-4,6-dideoxygalactose transaminase
MRRLWRARASGFWNDGVTARSIPFLRPRPPRLSRLVKELEAIEASGIFSNYGPVNTRLEAAMTERLFNGVGGCLTVNNATTGLMIAIREAANRQDGRRYALMPSFTFAATAHAAIWAGLQPLFCDIDPLTWNACAKSEDFLLDRYRGQIACVVPYACFGNGVDLGRYADMAAREGVGLVVDAAASLGTLDENGVGFGAGFRHVLVYSMHATKTFATGEAGLLHCGDPERLETLRVMGNFGFGRRREATMPGLNAKLSEIGALLALARLDEIEEVVAHRTDLVSAYRAQLPRFGLQELVGRRLAHQFMPVLLPAGAAPRDEIVVKMQAAGIGLAHYFSPHLAEQAYFAECKAHDLTVTNAMAPRILSLPLADDMTLDQVSWVCETLRSCTVAS